LYNPYEWFFSLIWYKFVHGCSSFIFISKCVRTAHIVLNITFIHKELCPVTKANQTCAFDRFFLCVLQNYLGSFGHWIELFLFMYPIYVMGNYWAWDYRTILECIENWKTWLKIFNDGIYYGTDNIKAHKEIKRVTKFN